MANSEPGPEGRQKVSTRLSDVWKDEAFVNTYSGEDGPELIRFEGVNMDNVKRLRYEAV
jgi:hypothetical protein